MKKNTPRERLLLLVFPALLLFVMYVYTWNSSLQREIRAKRDQVDKAVASAPRPSEVAMEQVRVRKLQAEVEEWDRRRGAAQAELDRLAARCGSLREQGEAIGALNAVFEEHRLHVEEEGPAVAGQAEQAVPGSLRAALERLKKSPQYRPPQLFRVKFVGRYADVARALRRVVDDELAFPVQVQMDESNPSTEYRVWTLHVWI